MYRYTKALKLFRWKVGCERAKIADQKKEISKIETFSWTSFFNVAYLVAWALSRRNLLMIVVMAKIVLN